MRQGASLIILVFLMVAGACSNRISRETTFHCTVAHGQNQNIVAWQTFSSYSEAEEFSAPSELKMIFIVANKRYDYRGDNDSEIELSPRLTPELVGVDNRALEYKFSLSGKMYFAKFLRPNKLEILDVSSGIITHSCNAYMSTDLVS